MIYISIANKPHRTVFISDHEKMAIHFKHFEWVPSYLLDVVVAQGAAILKLLTGEDQTLLVGGDTLLVLDLGLDVVDGVARLNVEGNGLTREGLDETIIGVLSALLSSSSFVSYLSQPVLGRIGGF